MEFDDHLSIRSADPHGGKQLPREIHIYAILPHQSNCLMIGIEMIPIIGHRHFATAVDQPLQYVSAVRVGEREVGEPAFHADLNQRIPFLVGDLPPNGVSARGIPNCPRDPGSQAVSIFAGSQCPGVVVIAKAGL